MHSSFGLASMLLRVFLFAKFELQLVLETCQMMKLQLLLVLKLWRCIFFMAVHFGFFKSAVRTFGNPQPVQ